MLRDWLAYRAGASPQRTALVAGGRSWSYAALDAEVARTARQLAGCGAGTGDRIAVALPNGSWPAVLAHAALRLGATLVPINTRLAADEVAWQLRDARPRLTIVEERTASLVATAGRDAGRVLGVGGNPAAALAACSEADVALRDSHDPEAVLAIVYTSGTTARPRGAMLTVGNFWWSAVGSALNIGTHDDDRWLACLPLFHVGGLSIVIRSAVYGVAALIHERFDPAAVNRAIDEDGVTIVSLVAVMLQRLLDERADRPCPPSLRCVLLGGGPAPRPLLERCAAIGLPVAQTYGLTETTSQVATLRPEDGLRKLGSAGRPLYPNEIRIANDHEAASADGAGEILVRGPVVMAGYAGQRDATARTIVDGWLHTGDVGRLDADGYLYVLDRRDDLIVRGGENVYPAEVEAALLAHPAVLEAGAVGVADPTWGRRVVAIVRLHDAREDVEALMAHCRMRLAGYKVPSEILVSEESLPRTASGKLQRSVLAARVAAGSLPLAATRAVR